MGVADRIKARRLQLHMSQEELAEKLGYKSKSSINKIELGRQNLTQTKIKAIADALDTSPSYIMGARRRDKSISIRGNALHSQSDPLPPL